MKILITGGAGFIGSHFVKFILKKEKNVQIINLDKLTYAGNIKNIQDINTKRHIFVKGDICDEKLVHKLMKQCEIVINFAAETHVDRAIGDPAPFIKTNIFGVYILLEAAKYYKISKFIQISTDEVYGSVLKGYSKEDSLLSPGNPYSASKAAADHLVLSYFNTYKLPVCITRSSNNFGPNQYPEKIIPLFILNLLQNKPVPVYGDGLYIRDWLYVLDNCYGIYLVMKKGKVGEIYNIGAGNLLTNLELTHIILKMLNKPSSLIKYVDDRPGHDRRYAMNWDKIKKLGFKPSTSFEEGLKLTIDWYKSHYNWFIKSL